MSFLERIAALPQKKLALLAAELYERSLAAGKGVEPIAITAMACRMPGECNTPEALWSFLERGGDASETVSDERLALVDPALAASGAPRPCGTFLRDVDRFDPIAFGISGKEADSMDPQQRLLLEVCWEALENAGTPIDQLQGSATGVFVGISGIDYALLTHDANEPASGYATTSVANAIAAGRISYVFGFNGPSTALDTACSASAAAIHLACQSLRARECEQALAGGVNLALLPDITQTLASMEALAPDGRCKAFSAHADGFARGEGCAIIVLRRLSDATARGDEVLGVIRGSAWNQDGRSSGLTAPNGLAQERVVRAALDAAGLAPAQVSYVEAHGTGTPLGDPIEIAALGRVFGAEPRTGGPLRVGSVKTNVGHLEAAAGVAGVMKVVLALQHERIPPHLHATELNPRIDWPALPIEVPRTAVAWPRGEQPRVAGVSSFGFSGTNVHLIVGEAPLPADDDAPPAAGAATTVLTASAKSRDALLALAARYASALERGDVAFARFAAAANLRRSAHAHRLALVAGDARDAAEQLRMFASGDPRSRVRAAFVVTHRPPAVAFTGAHALGEEARTAAHERWRAFSVEGMPAEAAADGARTVELRDRDPSLDDLVDLYLAGVPIDWAPLHRGVSTAGVGLPNYAFERARHWTGVRHRAVPAPHAGEREAAASADGIYRIAWTPVDEGFNAPRPSAVFEALSVPAAPAGDDYAALARFEDAAETFAEHAVISALLVLRPDLSLGTQIPAADPCGALGVVPEHRRLLERGLRHLTERGIVRAGERGWTFVREVARYDLEAEIAALRVAFPGSKPEIDVAARTVELPRVLRGEIAGVDVLFPNGSFELANALYRETPSARLMNALVTEVIRGVSASARRRLRVLEIGAGTGGTTSAVLAALPPDAEYVFTDLSTAFFASARSTFGRYPNLRYEVLDIENLAQVDALAREPFDLVVAANVLHATASIRDTLRNARSLLRDGGVLVALEATMSLAIADVTFGATEGWSKRADVDLRPFGPLLSRERWTHVLDETGFEAATLPVLPEFGVVTEQHTIVVARRTAAAPRVRDALIVHRGTLPPQARAAFAHAGIATTVHDLGAAGGAPLGDQLGAAVPQALVFVGPQASDEDPAAAAQRALDDLLDVAQLVAGRHEVALWILTEGAHDVTGDAVRPAGGALWGFARVLASESPTSAGRIVDLPAAASARDWERVAALVAAGDAPRECAVRDGDLHVPRLAPAALAASGDALAIGADACYVVTGAFGALGLLTSRWLARRGAGTLILNGRREPGAAAQAMIDDVRAGGTRVDVIVADIGTPEGVDAVLATAHASGRALRGIVHSAAALDDAAIPQQTHATMAAAFAPKACAAWMLHERTRSSRLDFFALYSSTAALIGSRGQANYAAANGFLDALAHHRHGAGLPCTTIDWGLWEQSGAAVKRDQLESWTSRGVVPIGEAEGLDALARALASNEPQVAVLGRGLAVALRSIDPHGIAPLLRDLAAGSDGSADRAPAAGAYATLLSQLASADASERHAPLVRFVRARCAELLNLDASVTIPDDRPLIELGLDSLVGLELRNDLQNVLEMKLPSTLFFDYPTLGDLSRYLQLVAGAANGNGRAGAEVERISI